MKGVPPLAVPDHSGPLLSIFHGQVSFVNSLGKTYLPPALFSALLALGLQWWTEGSRSVSKHGSCSHCPLGSINSLEDLAIAWRMRGLGGEPRLRAKGLACQLCHLLSYLTWVPGDKLPPHSGLLPVSLAVKCED